jgi:hypothetical protein
MEQWMRIALVGVVWGILVAALAWRKNRNIYGWFLGGFISYVLPLTALVPVIVLMFLKKVQPVEVDADVIHGTVSTGKPQ